MWGTFVNVAAVLGGAVVGLLVGKRLPSRVSDAVMPTMGLFTLFLGIKTAFETENSMIVLFSLVIGTVIGSLIDIERHLDRLGEFLKRRVGAQTEAGISHRGAELGTASLGFNLSNIWLFACSSFSYVLLRLKPRLAVPSSAPLCEIPASV